MQTDGDLVIEGKTINASYFPDYNEANQGATGSGKSTKAYIDSISTNNATLVFRHNSGSATTTYTFSTNEIIPSNINIVIEEGALLSFTTGITLTIYNPKNIIAGENQKIFMWAGTGKVAFTKGGTMYFPWWGTVADGSTDDTAAIQAALSQACSKTIIFPPSSTAYIFSAMLTGTTQTTLLGYGATLKVPDSGFTDSGNDKRCLKFRGTVATPFTQVHVKGLTIDGNITGRGGSFDWRHGLDMEQCHNSSSIDVDSSNHTADGFYVGNTVDDKTSSAVRMLVEGCVGDSNTRQGISVVGLKDSVIRNCTFSNTSGQAPEAGIRLEPDEAAVPNQNISVENCRIFDNAGEGIGVQNNSTGIVVSNNYLSGNAGGVTVTGSGVSGITIADNYCDGFLQVTTATDCIIRNNHVVTSAERNIFVQGERTIVIGNIITGSTGGGIYVSTDYNIIKNNSIFGINKDSINILNTSDYNIISGNLIQDQVAAEYHMSISGNYNTVSDNIIKSSLGAGGSKGLDIGGNHNRLYNNFVEGCNPVGGFQILGWNLGHVVDGYGNWDSSQEMFLGMPYSSVHKTIDFSGAAPALTVWTVPANMSFMPDVAVARIDNDMAATNGDYWSLGVNQNNKRVDYGVCTTAAAADKHSANAKLRFVSSPIEANQIITTGLTLTLMSVNGTGDAAALSNNIGGAAGDSITVVVQGRVIEDLPNL